MATQVANFLKSCHPCQVMGKPNQVLPIAPLYPIPAVEPPFTRVLIDIVGPLPVTSMGNRYLLTVMDLTTRYPEAMPIRSIHAKVAVKNLLTFFTRFGFSKEIQSDRGINFTSNLFAKAMKDLNIYHIVSSAYHPQSQGALERHHQTLKRVLRTYCQTHGKDWDQGVQFALFALREAPSESLGFSPNQLVFGHRVRGPLEVIREAWCGDGCKKRSLLEFVLATRERLTSALEIAKSNLAGAQGKMKEYYDKKVKEREFQVGDEVLALLPMQGRPLAAKFSGPYKIIKKIGALDYVVMTSDRRKDTQLCHINMLKPYYRREEAPLGVGEPAPERSGKEIPVVAVKNGTYP